MFVVVTPDFQHALPVVGALLQLVDDVVNDVVFYRLLIMRRVARVGAVKIFAPHIERVFAEVSCDGIKDALDGIHALRPTEAAKSGVRHRIGLAAVRDDRHVFEKVGIVAMENCAVIDGARQVRRHAATRCKHEFDAFDPA